MEIMYNQGSEFISHDFRTFLIEIEYRITDKPSTSVNPTYNATLGQICQVLGNLVQTFNIKETYVDEDDPWSGILSAESFVIHKTTNRLKGYSIGQLLFGRDMILPIKHKVDWELIRQQKQMQINKDNIHKNNKRVDHDYKVGYKVVLNNHAA